MKTYLLGALLVIELCNFSVWGQCNVPVSTPQYFAVSVESATLTIKIFDYQPTHRYRLFRSRSSLPQNWTEIARFSSSQYSDADINIDPSIESYCYRLKAEDNCGNLSDFSRTFCSIHLTGIGGQLTWNNPLKSSEAKVTYQVFRLDNPLEKVSPTLQKTTHTVKTTSPDQPETYRVVATITWEANGQIFTDELNSNLYEPISFSVFIPDIFTPNADGHNDTWKIQEIGITSVKVSVFNRWGEPIFTSNSFQMPWDGNLFDGTSASVGWYSYKIEYIDFKKQQWVSYGQVQLLR